MDSDQGKIFVGGIPWETTEEKMKEYFSSFGEVSDVVIMKDRLTGRARGFGFVVFADPSVADSVLAEKHTIEGRLVETKKAVPREEQHNMGRGGNGNPASGGVGQIRTKKIFVGGLASTVTEEDFRQCFEQFGTITDVVVMYDHNTQRHRGFGFITFDTEDAVERVLQKSFHELKEKTVEVKRAIPKDQSNVNQSGRLNQANNFNGGRGAGGSPYNTGYGQGYGSRPGSATGGGYGGPTGRGGGVYSPYGPSGGYPHAGYAVAGGYPPAMNGGYGAPNYNAPGYGAMATQYGGGYGAPQGVAGYGPGYGGGAPGSRSPWGVGVGGGGGASNNGAVYSAGNSPSVAAGTYGGPSPAYSSPGQAGVYSSGESGYGNYAPRGRAAHGNGPSAPPSSGYMDNSYGHSGYPNDPSHYTSANDSAAGYASLNGPPAPPPTANYGGYGNKQQQSQHSPETRFRSSYPAAR